MITVSSRIAPSNLLARQSDEIVGILLHWQGWWHWTDNFCLARADWSYAVCMQRIVLRRQVLKLYGFYDTACWELACIILIRNRIVKAAWKKSCVMFYRHLDYWHCIILYTADCDYRNVYTHRIHVDSPWIHVMTSTWKTKRNVCGFRMDFIYYSLGSALCSYEV